MAADFVRGVSGLGKWLKQLWSHRRRRFYLGEWHFHPFGSPMPSTQDDIQMKEIAQLFESRCPEPVLLIVGGDPKGGWSLGAFVYVCDNRIDLKAQ
jgi:hypothetical protein